MRVSKGLTGSSKLVNSWRAISTFPALLWGGSLGMTWKGNPSGSILKHFPAPVAWLTHLCANLLLGIRAPHQRLPLLLYKSSLTGVCGEMCDLTARGLMGTFHATRIAIFSDRSQRSEPRHQGDSKPSWLVPAGVRCGGGDKRTPRQVRISPSVSVSTLLKWGSSQRLPTSWRCFEEWMGKYTQRT